MFEDHLLLESEVGALASFLGPEIHGMGDADVGVGEAHRVEVSPLFGRFTTRLCAVEQAGEIAVNVIVGQFAVFIHPAQSLGAVLHGVPVVTDDLVALLGHRVFVLPTTDVAVEGTRFHPCAF